MTACFNSKGFKSSGASSGKKKKFVSITTESMFSKEHFSCSIKHPATCIKAEGISEFSERFSELGFRQALIFSSFTSQYRLRLCEFSKTPHVCFQSLSSPREKHFLIAHLSSHISPSLSDCMSARPSHSMLGRDRLLYKRQISHYQTTCHCSDRLNA